MRAELTDAGFGGFEIVDADLPAQRGGGSLGAERPALDHVLPCEIVPGNEGAGSQRRGGALAIMVRGEKAENALESLDVPLVNSKVSVGSGRRRMPEAGVPIQTV